MFTFKNKSFKKYTVSAVFILVVTYIRRLMGFDVYFVYGIKERCKNRLSCFYIFHCELYFCSSRAQERRRKKKRENFPVKLIRFFVRSISCRRRASPGTVPAQPRSRGLPVINFTSLESQDFRSAGFISFYIYFIFFSSRTGVIKRTLFKPAG